MHLLRLALRPFRLAPGAQAISVVSMATLIFLFGLMIWAQAVLRPVVHRLEHEQVITAYVAPTLDPADEGKLVDTIRVAVGAADIQLVGTSAFLKELAETDPEMHQEILHLGADMPRVVPRYVSIAGVFPVSAQASGSGVLAKVRALPGIEQAESSRDRYRHVVGAYRGLRWGAIGLAIGLCLALLSGMFHASRLSAGIHAEVASLMRLWGADGWSVHAPALLSGLLAGGAAGLIALGLWQTGVWLLTPAVASLSPMLAEVRALGSTGWISLLLVSVGMVAGLGTAAASCLRLDGRVGKGSFRRHG
ncbi:MAG: hypothetical protein AB7P04_16035 [Bacteriovoracia bacterium]